MKIIIVAGAPVKSFAKLYHRNPSDYYIGVDAGCLELIKRGIKIDYAVGDFDSTEELEQIKTSSYGVSLHPKEKNETDLELALMHLDSLKGASDLEIEIYDATNGRLDHEYNIYMLLAKYSKYRIKLIDEHNQVMYLQSKSSYKIKNPNLKYFSIFTNTRALISVENAKYPLIDQSITRNDTYLISNERISKTIHPLIEVKKGGIYLFINY